MKTALTIGFFDGVHLGHQLLLRNLRKQPHATIITFTSHPQNLFNPPAPKLILPLSQKLELLKNYADQVIVLDFTPELASTTYEELLSQFELSHLILGEGSVFGKNREGHEANIRTFAENHGIIVQYIPKVLFEGMPISSSRIREAIDSGNIHLAQNLLGREL